MTEEKVTRLDQITEERLAKLERVRALGLSPYPNTFRRSHTAAEAVQLLENEEAAHQSKVASSRSRIRR